MRMMKLTDTKFFCCAQDEKNEMLHTNMWLNYVSNSSIHTSLSLLQFRVLFGAISIV